MEWIQHTFGIMPTASPRSGSAAQIQRTPTMLSARASCKQPATTTTRYPCKWFSVASSTGSGARFSTTTEYVFSGDTLVSTIDQQLADGVATGSPQTLYIHPDHLGSTNVITNASGTVVTTKDYYPYGSVRLNSGSAPLARGYTGQFEDQSNLNYLNARYYNPAQGQFISSDPVFLAIGDADRLKQLTGLDDQFHEPASWN